MFICLLVPFFTFLDVLCHGTYYHSVLFLQADIDGERFLWDLRHVLTRPTAYDAVMRVRTSTGVRATDFYGNFFMSNTTDVELATLGEYLFLIQLRSEGISSY